MTEERKFAILMAATILSARRIQESMTSDKPDMTKQFYVDRAIQEAAFILERIDKKRPKPRRVAGPSELVYYPVNERVPYSSDCCFIPSAFSNAGYTH